MLTSNYAEAVNWVTSRAYALTPPVIDIGSCGVLDEALVRDAAGNPPGSAGYQPTWNLPWAVALVYELKADALAADPVGRVTSFTSEGSSVTRQGGASYESLMALARRWKAKASGSSSGLAVIELGGAPLNTAPRSAHHGVTNDKDWR